MKKIFFILVFILVFGTVVFFVFKKLAVQSPSKTSSSSEEKQTKDINWDDKVDYKDKNMVESALGCKQEDPCWNKVIGKTVTGDNPIYSSDADFNKDGAVDDKDVQELGL